MKISRAICIPFNVSFIEFTVSASAWSVVQEHALSKLGPKNILDILFA